MNLTALLAAVRQDTFDASVDPTEWINAKYTELCDLDEWTFMRGSALVTVTSGSQAVTQMPTDFAIANELLDQYGRPLTKITDLVDFYHRYGDTTQTYVGQPEAFAVDGTNIVVGPTSNITNASFRLLYEKVATPLSAGSDVPIIPAGYHHVLVTGARAIGSRLYGMFYEAEEADAEYQNGIQSMQRKYLSPLRDKRPQLPAYRSDC